MSGPDISLDLPFNLIQVLRLAHALVEAGSRLHVSAEDAQQLSELRKIFGLQYDIGTAGVQKLRGVSIDHTEPEVRVGWITRPLIFPVAAFQYCRTRWQEGRSIRASFSGYPIPIRTNALNQWLMLSKLDARVPEHIGTRFGDGLLGRLSRAVPGRLGISRRKEIHVEGVKLVLTDEGRVSQRKAWNVDYYSSLLESEFALCPDGNDNGGSSWTYRVFESMLCGAIPVVEHSCAAYEGFRCRHMGEPLTALRWSRDDAEYNFDLALKRLTVPRDELRSEVDRLLAHPDEAPAGVVTMRREKGAPRPVGNV